MRLTGLVYRAHNPRWSFAPLSGAGAARHGGRFNAVGVPALYTSRRMETAWLEAQQGFPFKAQPLTICSYDVDCADIANLGDPATCEALGVKPADLACPWEDILSRGGEPPSWRLARDLTAAGHVGAIVPSFAPGAGPSDRNVIFWEWSDDLPHRVRVVDDEERLPRDDRSWQSLSHHEPRPSRLSCLSETCRSLRRCCTPPPGSDKVVGDGLPSLTILPRIPRRSPTPAIV